MVAPAKKISKFQVESIMNAKSFKKFSPHLIKLPSAGYSHLVLLVIEKHKFHNCYKLHDVSASRIQEFTFPLLVCEGCL